MGRPVWQPALLLRRIWPLLVLLAFVVALVLPVSAGPEQLERTTVTMLINLIAVVGLYVFVGNSGILSFGHISFMAIGAYASALVTIPPLLKSTLLADAPGIVAGAHMGTVPGIFLAAGVAAAFALILAGPLMRLTGLAASIGTFAFLIIVNTVISQWESLTRGVKAIGGVPTDTTLHSALVWALVAITIAFLFQETSVGLRLRASREDEAAAASVGISVVRERTIAFCLSAALVAVAGALYGHFLGIFVPNAFFIQLTAITYAMLVIGGIRSLAGAVVGTVVVSAVVEVARRFESGIDVGPVLLQVRPGLQEVALGAIMLGILLLRPRGITGGREITWPWREVAVGAGRPGTRPGAADPEST
jgi:branched-chain amino acid transport system permease protein